jgi:hypothetical protein
LVLVRISAYVDSRTLFGSYLTPPRVSLQAVSQTNPDPRHYLFSSSPIRDSDYPSYHSRSGSGSGSGSGSEDDYDYDYSYGGSTGSSPQYTSYRLPPSPYENNNSNMNSGDPRSLSAGQPSSPEPFIVSTPASYSSSSPYGYPSSIPLTA